MRKMELSEVRQLVFEFMKDNELSFFQITSSMSADKDRIICGISYEEESESDDLGGLL